MFELLTLQCACLCRPATWTDDGKHPSLTCGTSAGKVFIHSPHTRESASAAGGAGGSTYEAGTDPRNRDIRFLNINRKVTALTSGRLVADGEGDTLCVGTQTNLLAYNVEDNSDLFFKDVPDGVSTLLYGKVQSIEAPLVVVGGNCSIQGFDAEGLELFWTVTGDNVSAMAFCDADGDGANELLVGSDDYEIRIFRNEDVVSETTETEKIVDLCPIHLTRYGYALANGTVGVYNRSTRVWRVKSKTPVNCIESFDLDADGAPELLAGWQSGKFEVRNDVNGELIYKDAFPSAVSAIVKGDYRMDGRVEVIACAVDGEVRGYLPVEVSAETTDSKADEAAMTELLERKKELEMELRGLEQNMKAAKSGAPAGAGVLPPSTKVSLNADANAERECVELVVSTNNDTIIKSVVVFALDGGLFEGESLMVYPASPTGEVHVPLRSPKNTPTELKVQALVGARGSSVQYHVFELVHQLPRFAMYGSTGARSPVPEGKVTFYVPDRASRIAMWVNNNFSANGVRAEGDRLEAALHSLRDGSPLVIAYSPDNGGKITIRTDSMELAAEIVQALAADLGVRELESLADFPAEMTAFQEVLMRVDEYNAIRLKLTAEMADSSNLVKTLVIKAEDARILGDMKLMKRMYSELYTLNNELIGEYTKRSNNHQELLAALKEVNNMIQKAARLRVGAPKSRVVTACRAAIKANNIHSLFQIIREGKVAGESS